jgi:hypothetical protein
MKTTEDTRLDQLRRDHGGQWDIWKVPRYIGPTAWCTRPAGYPTAVHEEASPEHLDAWLRRIGALQDKGVTLQFGRDGWTITAIATWTDPAGTPATYGPAPASEVIDHAEALPGTQAETLT